MGRVITTNSATLVNKGLELLEAHLLYGIDLDRIDVVVHPQSIVHSMVQFIDGSTLAQCSPPDMRLPIALALSWPERLPGVAPACDWSSAASWTFEPLDSEAFPAVDLARRAGRWGGSAPAVYNAANEECVEAFHAGRIGFTDICDIMAEVLAEHVGMRPELVEGPSTSSGRRGGDSRRRGDGSGHNAEGSGERGADVGSTLVADDDLTVDLVLAADAWARRRAREFASTQEHPH
jgi:1-deoxy-D-xylulose-5-phosphate reductoisomerase